MCNLETHIGCRMEGRSEGGRLVTSRRVRRPWQQSRLEVARATSEVGLEGRGWAQGI